MEIEAASTKSRKRIFGGAVPKKMAKKQKDAPKEKSKTQEGDGSGTVTEDWLCLYCDEAYSASPSAENWVMCVACKEWAHEACAGTESYEDFYL